MASSNFIETVITGIVTNGLWDFIKILFGVIFGWFGHRYYNRTYVEGRKNTVKQKGRGNFSDVKGNDNSIDQSN